MQRRCRLGLRVFERARWLVLIAVLGASAPAVVAQTHATQEVRAQEIHAQAAASSVPGLTAEQQAEFLRARAAARKILAGAEFQRPEPTWWDKLKEKIGEFLVRLFLGVDRVTTQSPWVGRTLEWLLFVAAAVGVLVWVLRTVQRQRLRVAVGADPAKARTWDRKTEDWRRLAESEAAKGAWREAIHALYWAAIVHLEQRRAWRHNPSRTPREYVRLLKAGSEQQGDLRSLTNALEQTWYGHREPNEVAFGAARESFDRLAADRFSADRHAEDALTGGKA